MIQVDDPARADEIGAAVDARFANSPAETKTSTEQAFSQTFASQVGNIGAIMTAILIAVLFTILLITANTMASRFASARASWRYLKTLGFSDGRVMTLVMLESCLLAIVGGGLGLASAMCLIGQGDPTGGFLAAFAIPPRDLALGCALVWALGLGSGIVPGMVATPCASSTRCAKSRCDSQPGRHRHRPDPADAAATSRLVRGRRRRRDRVVIVFVAVLSIAEGFLAALSGAGSPDTAIVMRGGSTAETTSALANDATRIIKDAPGVLRDGSGPVASAELFVVVDVPKRGTGTDANVPLRGVEPAAFRVREEVRIVEGRPFREGTNEIIVGRSAANQFEGLELGATPRWGESSWEVVGIFEADGTLSESEIWCDARVLQPAYRRGNTYQSVLARLDSEEAFPGFRDALASDPRLDVMVEREDVFYVGQSQLIHSIITGIGTVIAS